MVKQAQLGAECRESGTLRSEWEVGVVKLPSTPTFLVVSFWVGILWLLVVFCWWLIVHCCWLVVGGWVGII